eukprot:1196311-Ditylum_brightwellii.AAC.1
MEKHKVFKPVPRKKLPMNAKVMTSTWAMKKKANAPIANDMAICIVMVFMLVAGWCEHIVDVDVEGAFLHGDFEDGEEIYME